jgi:diguanylate cyclase (GGDEF)-like protein
MRGPGGGEAEAEVARALRGKAPLALLMTDVDHFGSVNQTSGHQAGDQVLCDIARSITGLLADSQPAGRTAGGEFAVLLPQLTGPQARRVAAPGSHRRGADLGRAG